MRSAAVATLAALIGSAACAHQSPSPVASAVIESRSGSAVKGTVGLSRLQSGHVRLTIDLSGLTPGSHGFHIHETGDCSAPDASSAGAHFNPAGAPHGAPGASAHHAGDFGNVTADANGMVRTSMDIAWLTLDDGASSAIGKALVVHADPDDLISQPAGNAGKRVGCGVVSMISTR